MASPHSQKRHRQTHVQPRAQHQTQIHSIQHQKSSNDTQQIEQSMKTPAKQASLADFTIIQRLGQGSFGTCYLAKRHEDGCLYAIKAIDIAELSNDEQLACLDEIELMARLSSPYVTQYHDSFIDDGRLHIVMSYCERGDLQRHLQHMRAQEEKLGEQQLWAYTLDLLLGLYALHALGIIHRDCKPANMLLSASGTLQIADLGVARLLSNTGHASTMVGSVFWMAPELVNGERYDAAADVWAAGVIIYEMATLTRPFRANNEAALLYKILQGNYEPLPEHFGDLKLLVDSCLQLDASMRPSILELLAWDIVYKRLLQRGEIIPEDVHNLHERLYIMQPLQTGLIAADDHSSDAENSLSHPTISAADLLASTMASIDLELSNFDEPLEAPVSMNVKHDSDAFSGLKRAKKPVFKANAFNTHTTTSSQMDADLESQTIKPIKHQAASNRTVIKPRQQLFEFPPTSSAFSDAHYKPSAVTAIKRNNSKSQTNLHASKFPGNKNRTFVSGTAKTIMTAKNQPTHANQNINLSKKIKRIQIVGKQMPANARHQSKIAFSNTLSSTASFDAVAGEHKHETEEDDIQRVLELSDGFADSSDESLHEDEKSSMSDLHSNVNAASDFGGFNSKKWRITDDTELHIENVLTSRSSVDAIAG